MAGNTATCQAHIMAGQMLNCCVKDLDNVLYGRLLRADELAQKLGGSIGSRQIVATIIALYEAEQPRGKPGCGGDNLSD